VPYGSISDVVELRDATPADAHGIANVLVRSWRAAYRGLLPDEVLAGLSVADREQFWSDAITARLPHRRAVVATLAGAIVGLAATGPPLVPADRADPTLGDLYALYLDPDVWRRGIGTELHAAALDCLRSCGFTHAGLWVLDTNERALRFYLRHGWTATGRSQVDQGPGGTELHERRLQRNLSDGTGGCDALGEPEPT
jgi:ribosomal protein S18 acetylase RimI-like enzyme